MFPLPYPVRKAIIIKQDHSDSLAGRMPIPENEGLRMGILYGFIVGEVWGLDGRRVLGDGAFWG